jgi:hypothetical protein
LTLLLSFSIEQLTNFEFLTDVYVALETATAPPRTTTVGRLAPSAVQLKKRLEEMVTPDRVEPGATTAKAPPML